MTKIKPCVQFTFLIGEKTLNNIGPAVISATEKIKWGKGLQTEEMGVGTVN